MEVQYYKEYSPSLGREVEFKRYGHAGRPVLYIPCQDGRFFDFESFNMTDYFGPYIDQGRVMVFSIDTIDTETWSDFWGDARYRIELYERWITYITDELIPFIDNIVNERNGWEGHAGVLVTGCSLGATHAVNLYLRRPDLFDSLLALSGIYDTDYGFGTYMDELVYMNNPIASLKNMPADHPYIEMYNNQKAVICCGQGPWERPESTRALDAIFREKGINIWVDFWGYDCAHDWPWWYKQVTYFLPHLLGEI